MAKALPSLQKSAKYHKYLAKIGMDFENLAQIKEKIVEELNEVLSAKPQELEMECGDLLFAVVNLLRFMGVDGEVALNKACAKFEKRVIYMDEECAKKGVELKDLKPSEQELLWQEAKKNENR